VTHGFDHCSNLSRSLGFTSTAPATALDLRAGFRAGRAADGADLRPATGILPETVALMDGYQYFPVLHLRRLQPTNSNSRIATRARSADFGRASTVRSTTSPSPPP
jgi:hypothetical protein